MISFNRPLMSKKFTGIIVALILIVIAYLITFLLFCIICIIYKPFMVYSFLLLIISCLIFVKLYSWAFMVNTSQLLCITRSSNQRNLYTVNMRTLNYIILSRNLKNKLSIIRLFRDDMIKTIESAHRLFPNSEFNTNTWLIQGNSKRKLEVHGFKFEEKSPSIWQRYFMQFFVFLAAQDFKESGYSRRLFYEMTWNSKDACAFLDDPNKQRI